MRIRPEVRKVAKMEVWEGGRGQNGVESRASDWVTNWVTCVRLGDPEGRCRGFGDRESSRPARETMRRMALACVPLGISTVSVRVAAFVSLPSGAVGLQATRFLFCENPVRPLGSNVRNGQSMFLTRSGARSFCMSSPRTTPNETELKDVSAACSQLWELDSGRCIPGTDYEIDLQKGKKSSWHRGDVAAAPLFKFVKDEVLQRDTVRTFIALLDNYQAETGVAEKITKEEAKEDLAFLHAIISTPPMQYVKNYLLATGHLKDGSDEELRIFVQHLWFRPYRRETRNDSSGFEHVFLGEIRDNEVIGLHNWLRIYQEEQSSNLNFVGYITPKSAAASPTGMDPNHDQVVSMQFEWNGCFKPVGTSFIGTSPEFEIALYTLCYVGGQGSTRVALGPYAVDVKVHTIGGSFLGSAYPSEPKA